VNIEVACRIPKNIVRQSSLFRLSVGAQDSGNATMNILYICSSLQKAI
jgi:hypothetical protein